MWCLYILYAGLQQIKQKKTNICIINSNLTRPDFDWRAIHIFRKYSESALLFIFHKERE
jgi:hypothetical protein